MLVGACGRVKFVGWIETAFRFSFAVQPRIWIVARIRTIKPEFCTSEQVAECSTNARLLFVLMWCFCDDAGRHPANMKRLKMECFPGDSVTDKQVRGWVDELIKNRLLSEYTFENVGYLQVTGWKKHQKIDKPSYKYPPLDKDGNPIFVERSPNGSGTIDERSPPEWNGMEGSGEERNGVDDSSFDENASNKPKLTEYGFVLCDGSEWFLPQAKLDEYAKSFPELDIRRELLKASQWLRDNPKKRKTKNGVCGFVGRWLGRAQDSGKGSRSVQMDLPTFAEKRVANNQAVIERFANGIN